MKALLGKLTSVPLLASVLSGNPALANEDAGDPIDQLSQSAIQSAFQVLRSEYIHQDDLTFETLNRAALDGLLKELGTGAEIVAREDADAENPEGHLESQLLTQDIGWLRPSNTDAAVVDLLKKQLRDWQRQEVDAVILDLRTTGPPGEFDVVARVLDLFFPRGELLFRLRQFGGAEEDVELTDEAAIWTGTLLVLVNDETTTVGEGIAAVLQQKQRALLIGETTRGALVRYEYTGIDDRWQLRPWPAHLPELGQFFDVLSVETGQAALLGEMTAEELAETWDEFLTEAQQNWMAEQ